MAKFKQACFAHDLSKKFQIFAAIHKSNVFSSAAKILLSNLSPNLSAYHTVRIQRHHHHKEHAEVKKQSILRYLLGGGLMGHKYQFFCRTILYFFPKRTLVITISDQVLH